MAEGYVQAGIEAWNFYIPAVLLKCGCHARLGHGPLLGLLLPDFPRGTAQRNRLSSEMLVGIRSHVRWCALTTCFTATRRWALPSQTNLYSRYASACTARLSIKP